MKKSKRDGQYKCGECGRTFKHPMHLGKHQAAHVRAGAGPGASQDRSGAGKQPRGATRGRRQGVGTGRGRKRALGAAQAVLGAIPIPAANERQVGGDHYRPGTLIQPWDYIAQVGAGYFDGAAIKYLSRWRQKGGVDDLRKAQHYIDKLIELEAGK